MPAELTPEGILTESLAEHATYWNAVKAAQGGRLTAAQERWKQHELEWRVNLARKEQKPADWLVADIRCGNKERRDRANMEELQRSRARLAMWRREGYSFDAEHRLVAPQAPRIHMPRRFEDRAPRGRRPGSRVRARAPGREPDEPEPALTVVPLAQFLADLEAAGL
jgi:hypothetical protein